MRLTLVGVVRSTPSRLFSGCLGPEVLIDLAVAIGVQLRTLAPHLQLQMGVSENTLRS